ncbi:hypothetical protein N9M21_04175 [Alphaproteobacteria bacterium]|jgi:hypothetical protein|nr:hypothetical protein [Alphaproteobacteria bacterium]MDA8603598.1 hypothetical protein [Alphaproteobacteria bacterium]
MDERLIALRASMLPSLTSGHWRDFDAAGLGQILLGPGDWLPWLSWPFAVEVWIEEGDIAVLTTSADGVSAQAHHLPFNQGTKIEAETDLTVESLGRWSLINLQAATEAEGGSNIRFDAAKLRDEDWFPGPHNGN